MTGNRLVVQTQVMENLLDGLMVIERGGAITAFNAAATRILEITPEEAGSTTFAELFIARAGFEELNELLLDAVAAGGGGGRKVVSAQIGGGERRLSVATSYIGSAGGGGEPAALIAVLTDVTELQQLRDAERRMAEAMKAQHAELQTAYREIEERNDSLAGILKKVQAARAAATMLVFAGFVGAGLYVWRPTDIFSAGLGSPAPAVEAGTPGEGLRRLTVEPGPVRETVDLVGELAPWKTVPVPSPIKGRIAAVHFQYGRAVKQGDLLLEVGTGRAVREHREARVAYLEKLKEFEAVRDWDKGAEVSAATRALTNAKMALEDQENRLRQSSFLMEQGLIASARHEDAERQYRSRLLGFEAAQEDLERTRARGGERTLEKAALELASAEEQLQDIARRLERARVRAPLSGVAIAAPQSGARSMYPGRLVSEGQALLAIGDFDRLSATAKVDEVDVVRLAVGQEVRVTGDAFPGLRLRGLVTHVSSQPVRRARGAAEFEVVVTLDPVERDWRKRLRAGMSGKLQIVVYSNENALMAPVEAVRASSRAHRLRVLDPASGEGRERKVEVGVTTQDSVEIVQGLKAGETILVPAR